MHERWKAELDEHLSAARVSALVRAHRTAYGRAVIHHSPDDGWDRQLFGFVVYKYITKRLLDLCRSRPAEFELRSARPAFRIGMGPFTLAPYGCGSSGDQDINESFPNNENGAPALAEANQLSLGLENTEHVVPRALVLAHLGNAEHGLEALYVTVPGSTTDGRISEWSYTHLLWKKDATSITAEGSPDLPRPVAPAAAVISLKPGIFDRSEPSRQ